MHSGPEVVECFLMILVGAMGEIEPSNIHPSPKKLLNHGHRTRSWTQSADNFSLANAAIIRKPLQDAFDVNVGHYYGKMLLNLEKLTGFKSDLC